MGSEFTTTEDIAGGFLGTIYAKTVAEDGVHGVRDLVLPARAKRAPWDVGDVPRGPGQALPEVFGCHGRWVHTMITTTVIQTHGA